MQVAVVASGAVADGDVEQLDGADLVIAADGGAATLDRVGRRPDLVVGDMDSIEPELLARLEDAGTRVERHPADKDASDTELAIAAALAAGATRVVLLGATGRSRLDHELANLLLLVDPELGARRVSLVRGDTVVRGLLPGDPLALRGEPGGLVSLLPVSPTTGITTAGLRWELVDASLPLGRSRGLSNVIVTSPATVRIARGAMLVVETAAGKDRL